MLIEGLNHTLDISGILRTTEPTRIASDARRTRHHRRDAPDVLRRAAAVNVRAPDGPAPRAQRSGPEMVDLLRHDRAVEATSLGQPHARGAAGGGTRRLRELRLPQRARRRRGGRRGRVARRVLPLLPQQGRARPRAHRPRGASRGRGVRRDPRRRGARRAGRQEPSCGAGSSATTMPMPARRRCSRSGSTRPSRRRRCGRSRRRCSTGAAGAWRRTCEPRDFGDPEIEAVVLVALLGVFGARPRPPADVDATALIIERGLLGR